MSVLLTNSVVTQRQEMIDTAKRCNVRRGMFVVLPLLLVQEVEAFLELKMHLMVEQRQSDVFLIKHTEAGLSVPLPSWVPGELNPDHM